MDKIVRIWVSILGDGSPPTGLEMPADSGPYRPDISFPMCELPARARGASEDWYNDSIIENLTVAKRPPPCHTFMRIGVYEKDLARIGSYLLDADVPERDRLISEMVRTCRGDYDAKADAFFDGIPDISTGSLERKQMAVNLLEQARHRGLGEEKELEIAERLDLTDVEMVDVGGGRQ